MKDQNFFENASGASPITTTNTIKIEAYEAKHQSGIEDLVLPIQQLEFAVAITREEQPDLLNITETFQSGKGNFWVAAVENQVVGCIGLVDIADHKAALKKMFVHKDFRGKQWGVSRMLIQRAREWCAENGIEAIFLGTVSQMLAAHKFYEKNGFTEITIPQLPVGFPLVHVDTKFYRCDLI